MKLDRQWVSIDDLIADLRQVACSLLAHRDRRLLAPSSPAGADLLTDPPAVRGILSALLVDAARFSSLGDVALRITRDAYAVRFSIETERERDAAGTSVAETAAGTYLALCQAVRLARLLGGEVVTFEADGKRKLSLVLPRVDAVGQPLLRAMRQIRTTQPAAILAA